MKITLDLSKLVEEGKLTPVEAEWLKTVASDELGSLGINILIDPDQFRRGGGGGRRGGAGAIAGNVPSVAVRAPARATPCIRWRPSSLR
jgi:hypothetical protein